MKKWLFNPFVYIAGTKALIIGWGLMLITAVVSFFAHAHFDGAIDAHFGASAPFVEYLAEPFVDWACLVVSFYILGRIVSDTVPRLVDVAGTIALARWVALPMAFLGFIHTPAVSQQASVDEVIKAATSTGVIIQGLLVLPLTVWLIALFYNAFSISTNLKKQKAVWTFIAGLIVAEVISKVILMYLPFGY